VPPHPPPWFPPLESPFRGAPSARNGQRGKPIPTSARKAKWFSPSWSLGEWRKPSVVCPLGHGLCSLFFSPHRRPGEGRGGPQRPDGAGQGQRPCGGFGFQSRKRPGLKAKGPMIFPPPTLYPSFRVCGKAASVSEHSSGFATPSAPRWLPGRQENNNRKGKAGLKEKSDVVAVTREVQW
jgi:hypothetical protein